MANQLTCNDAKVMCVKSPKNVSKSKMICAKSRATHGPIHKMTPSQVGYKYDARITRVCHACTIKDMRGMHDVAMTIL